MDPFSITASAVTLIEAAGIITKSLWEFYHALRTTDSRLASLCDELKHLTDFLAAVSETLKGCRTFDLALIEEELWRQSDAALVNCQMTLNDLGNLIKKIKDNAASKRFGWKARAVIDLSMHGNDLIAFRDKIHKSNWALQTILYTITVSLSLRNQASQGLILKGLDKLKSSIDEALRESRRPAGGFAHALGHHSDARVTRNLQDLANAARHFYSAASSSASTCGGRSETAWEAPSAAAMSISGDFPPVRRERVEMFVRGSLERSNSIEQKEEPKPEILQSNNTVNNSWNMQLDGKSVIKEDEDYDADFERDCVIGLQQLAIESIKAYEFVKAGNILEQALAGRIEWDPEKLKGDDRPSRRDLKIQLAVCYFFQGNWKLAEPIVTDLAAVKKNRDLIVCNLLHALALGYLSEYLFDKALNACQQALHGKKELCKFNKTEMSLLDYSQTLGLLATIFDMSDDYVHAELFRRQLGPNFMYQHPAHGMYFLSNLPDFLTVVFQTDASNFQEADRSGFFTATSPMDKTDPGSHHLCRSSRKRSQKKAPTKISSLSTLQIKSLQHQRLDVDTRKEVVVQPCCEYTSADEREVSPTGSAEKALEAAETPSPLRRRFTQIFITLRMSNQDKNGESQTSDSSIMPSEPRSRISRWSQRVGNQVFGSGKPRKLSKKRPEKQRNTNCRLLKWIPHKKRIFSYKTQRTSLSLERNLEPISPLGNDDDFTVSWEHRSTKATTGCDELERMTNLASTGGSSNFCGLYIAHELPDNSILEIPDTSLVPELPQAHRPTVAATVRRVQFALPSLTEEPGTDLRASCNFKTFGIQPHMQMPLPELDSRPNVQELSTLPHHQSYTRHFLWNANANIPAGFQRSIFSCADRQQEKLPEPSTPVEDLDVFIGPVFHESNNSNALFPDDTPEMIRQVPFYGHLGTNLTLDEGIHKKMAAFKSRIVHLEPNDERMHEDRHPWVNHSGRFLKRKLINSSSTQLGTASESTGPPLSRSFFCTPDSDMAFTPSPMTT